MSEEVRLATLPPAPVRLSIVLQRAVTAVEAGTHVRCTSIPCHGCSAYCTCPAEQQQQLCPGSLAVQQGLRQDKWKAWLLVKAPALSYMCLCETGWLKSSRKHVTDNLFKMVRQLRIEHAVAKGGSALQIVAGARIPIVKVQSACLSYNRLVYCLVWIA